MKNRVNKLPYHLTQMPDDRIRSFAMIQRIWICLLISIIFTVSGCGENVIENNSLQADSSVADAEDEIEISENISTEEDFPIKYETGGQFYEDLFLDSVASALGEEVENPFPYEELPSGICFSSYADWKSFWDAYPDTVNKDYEALYDETYFEDHQLIWFYLEVWNNLCSIDVEEIHYDEESDCIMMDVSWGMDPERGSIDLCSTYIVANFVEIQGKYPLNGDTPIEIQVTENYEY